MSDNPAPIWDGATPSAWQLEAMLLDRFHAAVDQLRAETVPRSYWEKVIASRERGR
jgi:hypothetical protein